MGRYVISRFAGFGVAIVLSLAFGAGGATAQTQYAVPPPPGGPPALATVQNPDVGKSMGLLEGAVKKVDPGAGTLDVSSGPFGVFKKTLEVTSDTHIQVEGRIATLADIQEGTTVKASYEAREGKNVATRIQVVMPTHEGEKSRAPAKRQ